MYAICIYCDCRSERPHGVSRGSMAARFLGLRVRILPAAWISLSLVSVVYCQEESLRWVNQSPKGVLPCVVCFEGYRGVL